MDNLKKYLQLLKIVYYILTFSLFLFPFSYCTAQHMAIDWQGCYGGTDSDYSMDLVALNNGFLVLGNIYSNDFDVLCNHGVNDLFLVNIDNTGYMLWSRCYGGSDSDGSHRLFVNDDNTIYLLAGALSSDGDVSVDPYPSTVDYWILKIDSMGNIIWEKIVGGNGHDQVWSGTATSDGGVVAFGWTGSEDGDVNNYYGYYDIWLIKLNSEGEVVWDRTLGTNYFDWGQSIIETGDKGFLVGGTSYFEQGGNLACDTYHNALDATLVKLDSVGNIEWQQCYGGSYDESFTALLEITNGYIVAGYTFSDDGDVEGWHAGYDHLGNREADIWIIKTDLYGNLVWQRCLGGTRSESTSYITETSDGDLVFFGHTQSNDGDITGNHSNSEHNHDIWMVKISSEGELLWQQCIGGEGNEEVHFGVIQKSDNRYVVAGRSGHASDDVDCELHQPQGGPWYPDFWVFEVYDTTVNVSETSVNQQLMVYPNPANNYVIFELPVIQNKVKRSEGSNLITITNTFGQLIVQLELKDNKTVWDARQVNNGVYFYLVEFEGKLFSGKVVIQK